MKITLALYIVLLGFATVSCQMTTKQETAHQLTEKNPISKDSANMELINSLGKRDLYEHAKWAMYCLYCDSLVRFKKDGIRYDKITYGCLQLSLDTLMVSRDTISFIFRFIYDNKELDTNRVYTYNFPWWSIRYTEGTIKSMQLFISENKDLVRYFKPENPFDTQLKYSFPNVIEYINKNKDHIDPWFRIEAEKRHLLH